MKNIIKKLVKIYLIGKKNEKLTPERFKVANEICLLLNKF